MMKKTLISLFLMMLSMLLLLQSCIQPEVPSDETGGPVPSTPKDPVHYYENATYVYRSQVDEEVLLTGMSAYYLLLANKEHPVGEDYAPDSVVELTCEVYGGRTLELEARTAQALYLMLNEMYADGVTDIYVTSAYRTYAYQASLYNHYLQIESSDITDEAIAYFGKAYIDSKYTANELSALDHTDAEKVVLSYSAKPGTSEHQTGLCVDFITSTMTGLNTTFENTDAFAWLSQNAYKFGFILRYPKGKEGITGYTYEPWHYRFVGREAATDIYYGHLTLEEYLGV